MLKGFDNLREELNGCAEQILTDAVDCVVDQARSDSRVDTGRLRSSIIAELGITRTQFLAEIYQDQNTADYGVFVDRRVGVFKSTDWEGFPWAATFERCAEKAAS